MIDAPSLDEVVAASSIPYPNKIPYTHISLGIVAWNEANRLAPLLKYLRPYFEVIGVAVQESTDGTLGVAKRYADVVVTDKHRGFGDASFGPLLLPEFTTRYTLKVDADERPSRELLRSLSNCTWFMEEHQLAGAWLPFHSAVEGIEYTEQHSHLRLFNTRVGWPPMLHSRPMIENTCYWPVGYYRHDRSLDEMMQDYLRYWDVGRGDPGWEGHNRLMMHDACAGTARVKGWAFVQSFAWWPAVEAIAFTEEKPWLSR